MESTTDDDDEFLFGAVLPPPPWPWPETLPTALDHDTTYRDLVRNRIIETVGDAISGRTSDEIEHGLKEVLDRFSAAVDGVPIIATLLEKRIAEDGPPPLTADIFDDPNAMARNNVDMDIFDDMRLVLHDGVDLDDRAAVERAVNLDHFGYRKSNPEFQARFVDEVIRSAKANKAAGGLERHAHGESGFVLPPLPRP